MRLNELNIGQDLFHEWSFHPNSSWMEIFFYSDPNSDLDQSKFGTVILMYAKICTDLMSKNGIITKSKQVIAAT